MAGFEADVLRTPRALFGLLLIAALAGCTCGTKEAPLDVAADGDDAVEVPGDGGANDPSAASGNLGGPRIVVGGEGARLPESIEIIFAEGSGLDLSDTSNTKVTVTPALQGQVHYQGLGTLAFHPSTPFAYDTEYRLVVEAVGTAGGVLEPPSEGAWSTTFRTPPFRFLHASFGVFEASRNEAQVELHFSGPVDPEQVRRRTEWLVAGAPIQRVTVRQGNSGDRVRVTLNDPRLVAGASLQLQLRSGTPPRRGEGTAPKGSAELRIPEGKRLHIRAAALLEGSSGFYVEVSCQDLEPSEAPYEGWEGEEHQERYWGPSGCTVSETVARAHISFEPKVNFTVSPSRRGFRLFGDFNRGNYKVKVKSGLTSVAGGELFNPFERAFQVGPRSPKLTLGSTGRYLPRAAWKSLSVGHMNLASTELVVRRIPPQNLVFWLSDPDTEQVTQRVGDTILRRKLLLQGKPDALTTTYVDLAKELPTDTRGVLEVSVTEGGVRAASRLLLTDMSLVAKTTPATAKRKGQVLVWALGIEDNAPLDGVEVELVRRSGKTVATCKTSGAKGCRMEFAEDPLDPSANGFALIARKGSDFTYIRYADLKTEIATSDVQGESFSATQPYRAAIWSDRGVYRPGDVAHLSAVVRGKDGVAPKEGLPVELRVVDPRERVLTKKVLKANVAGLVGLDLPFEAFADTGVYNVRMLVADREIGRYALNVEEFVPERMKVEVSAREQGSLLGEAIPVTVDAVYLFGGSADGSQADLTCRLEEGSFRPATNGQFTYGVWSPNGASKPVTLGRARGTVRADGKVVLECPALTSAGGFQGPARLVAQAAVFESGSGRSTYNDVSVPVHPERYYLGLQANVGQVESGKPFKVSGVVVDWTGAPVKDVREVSLEASRLEAEYGYWWDADEGSERYTRQLRAVSESTQKVKVVDGRFELEITPDAGSEKYLVRVRSGKAQTDLVLDGGANYWSWDSGSQVDQTPRPMRATTLPLEVDGQARVGQALTVTAKAPYRGRMLFTAETDQVLAAEWRDVQAGETTWTFTPSEFTPNVYVSALLIKDPHLESAESFLPDRAFGVTSVTVEPVAFTQTVSLRAPAEVRSNEPLTVELDLGPQEGTTFATVAAVDEGILQLTRFKTPDPLATLISKRALGVETYETLGWTMLVAPQGNSRRTGGDGDVGAAGRVQPVKPVALYSGVIEVPASGKAKVTFQVPQYRGQLRVMAVTVDPKRVGRAEAKVLVRDPITLQATMPRFLTAMDTVEIPVFLTNLSGKAQDVKVALSAEDLPVPGLSAAAAKDSPLELLGKREGSVRIENGKSATLVFQARATKSTGAARLTVTASGGGFTSRESLDVPFAPSGPRERLVKRIELTNGVNDLKPHLAGWIPTTEQSTVWVTANPYGTSFDHLKYLVRYPHGCIEQTTSTVRPMLFASALMESVDPTAVDGNVEGFVRAGISRVLAMQTPSGGFSYWPGNTEPVAWGTAYGMHMLLDAKDAGFEVPQDRLDDALAWVGKELDRFESNANRRSGYYDSHHGDAEPYLHYVLARSGKGRKGAIQKAIARFPGTGLTGQQSEQVYVLKAALHLAGDRRYEKDLRSPEVAPVTNQRSNGWSFYSDRRSRGLRLSFMEDLFPNAASSEPMAQLVANALAGGQPSRWYTTQELAWGITGLGKRVARDAGSFGTPTLLANGKSIEAKVNPKVKSSERTWALARASEYPSLAVKIDKKGDGKVYAMLSSQGVRESGTWKVGGEGLTVTRTWRNLEGGVVDVLDAGASLADLIFVEIKVTNRTSERLQNLALIDRLPAGFEIENPRLGRGTAVEWAPETWNADYLSVKDDRLEMFGAIEAGKTATVVYAVRAVTSGTFTVPPVEVEAMYNPDIWAREAGGRIQIAGPWKDYLL